MWKNQFLGLREMTEIKVMTNMAEGIGEKQLLFRLKINLKLQVALCY